MFLTAVNMIRRLKIYPQSRWYKHEKLKEQAKHFKMHSLRVRYGMAKDHIRRALVHQFHARRNKGTVRDKLRIARLEAACGEHGISHHVFRHGLRGTDVMLSQHMMTILAIYEPRTFEQLVELSRRAHVENYHGMNAQLPERRLTAPKPERKLTTGSY